MVNSQKKSIQAKTAEKRSSRNNTRIYTVRKAVEITRRKAKMTSLFTQNPYEVVID